MRLSLQDFRERVELLTELEITAFLLAATCMGNLEYREYERRLAVFTKVVNSDSYHEAGLRGKNPSSFLQVFQLCVNGAFAFVLTSPGR